MKKPVSTAKLAFGAFLSLSGLPCAGQSSPTAEEMAGVKEITRFLEVWFVQNDFKQALEFLSPEESICLPAHGSGDGEQTLLPRELVWKRLDAELRAATLVLGRRRSLKRAIRQLPNDSRGFWEQLDLGAERRFTVWKSDVPLTGGECEGFTRSSSAPQLSVGFLLNGPRDNSYALCVSFEIVQGKWSIVFFDRLMM